MMEGPARRPNRLPKFDYSQAGYYFVTICTHQRQPLFWLSRRAGLGPAPTDWLDCLNPFGRIVLQTWQDLPNHNSGMELDKFVVMPNHVHGIVRLLPSCVGAGPRPARPTLSEIIRQFKGFSARRINQLRETPATSVWHRSFHDHIIRNEPDYLRIWQYIDTNPLKWEQDRYYTPSVDHALQV